MNLVPQHSNFGSMRSTRLFKEVLENKVYVAQDFDAGYFSLEYEVLQTESILHYWPFADDFGPMDMAQVTTFVRLLAKHMKNTERKVVYIVEAGRRALANAGTSLFKLSLAQDELTIVGVVSPLVFLLGCYEILKLNLSIEEVRHCFRWADDSCVEQFRDATNTSATFRLSLIDCWQSVIRSKGLGWVEYPTSDMTMWGQINIEEYQQYDSPLNANLHVVVPGKFVAFQGPKDICKREFVDSPNGNRIFSATYYVDIFDGLGVTDVVRLNEPEYSPDDFENVGIAVHELQFPDCTNPTDDIVLKFFRIVDRAKGLVAVHCRAGLGRTGTLIALYMMRVYGFTAREAMGWLRIMRPGSILGGQQSYLCGIERKLSARSLIAKIGYRRASLTADQSSSSPSLFPSIATQPSEHQLMPAEIEVASGPPRSDWSSPLSSTQAVPSTETPEYSGPSGIATCKNRVQQLKLAAAAARPRAGSWSGPALPAIMGEEVAAASGRRTQNKARMKDDIADKTNVSLEAEHAETAKIQSDQCPKSSKSNVNNREDQGKLGKVLRFRNLHQRSYVILGSKASAAPHSTLMAVRGS